MESPHLALKQPSTTPEVQAALASRNTVVQEERRDVIQAEIQSELTRLMAKTSHLNTVAKDLPRLVKGLRLMKGGDIPEIVRESR